MPVQILVIGLCGEAGSGKTTVAAHLEKMYLARRCSFAEPLKRMSMDIWGFSHAQVFGDATIKEKADDRTGIVPRWALKKLGQAARDHLGEDIWTSRLLAGITEPGVYVIEDVRYRNEAALINEMDRVFIGSIERPLIAKGVVLRLHCSDSVSTDDGTHPSEAEVALIPPEHIHREIYGSRAQGLPHLFGEVNEALRDLL